ncbi:MAG TPA: hypothetical protein VIF15_11360 [Polyangiaceae bacterium]
MKRSTAAIVALLAGCNSGPDPSGGGVSIVQVAPTGSTFVGSAVLGQSAMYVVTTQSLDVVRFAPDLALPSTWNEPVTSGGIELASAPDGTLWWAANVGFKSSLWTSSEPAFLSGPSAALTTFPGPEGSNVVGLAVDGTAVFAAVATPQPANPPPGQVSPDAQAWPGTLPVDTPATGSIYRMDRSGAAAAQALDVPLGITFSPDFMLHVLAQTSTAVYWVDASPGPQEIGHVMFAPKASWSAQQGKSLWGLAQINGLPMGFVGLAANDAYVAWAAAPEPFPGAVGCWIWAAPTGGAPKEIFDGDLVSTSFKCSGLAIDASYAYFAMVKVQQAQGNVVVVGTGIGRVPLGGGPLQTVSLQSERWYGPRRVLVDEANVYAIDPSYVLGFSKSAFGP